jgi:hypothetical protein
MIALCSVSARHVLASPGERYQAQRPAETEGSALKTIAVFSFAGALFSACSISGPRVMTRTFSAVLPTSYEFSVPWDPAKATILKGLQLEPERDDPFYQKYGFRPGEKITLYDRNFHTYPMQVVTFRALDVATSAKTGGYGSGVVDENHFYVDSSYAIASSYYYTKDGALPCKVSFAVGVVPVSNSRTKVSVQSIETHIFSGKEFNAHVLWFIPKPIRVQPVAAEEYKLLVYIAHLLGTSLPPLESYVKN